MTPIEWLTFGQILVNFGVKFATSWADRLDQAKAGNPVTPEERKAALAHIDYDKLVPNTFLTPATPEPPPAGGS